MRRRSPARDSLSILVLLTAGLTGCETLEATPPEELDLWSDARGGVEDFDLARLAEDAWDAWLASHPIQATYLGDPRFHGQLPDLALLSIDERRRELEEFQRRLRMIEPETLSEADLVTRDMLAHVLDEELERIALDDVAWLVDPLEGPHVVFLNLATVQPTRTARERRQLIERWNAMAGYMRSKSQHLLRGKRDGRVASRTAVEKTIEQLAKILAVDPMDSPLVTVATGGGRWVELPKDASVAELAHRELGDARHQRELRQINLHLQDGERLAIGTRVLLPVEDDPLTDEERGRFLYGALQAVEHGVYPALAAYREFLQKEILPSARSDEQPGLVHLPGGADDYRRLARLHTTLPDEECDPKVIHEYGLAEVERIRGEIAALGEKLFGLREVSAIQEKLRGDPALHFATREEVEAKAQESLERASARMGEFFGLQPRAACEVVRVPAHEEEDTTIAYYREPAPDGSRPGRYFINTFAPETRPRYEAEVLAYHESIPGHHLQIALAQELDALPLFRRHMGTTAFVEGWALYTERLCDEMELYSGDLDRLGVLSFDAWRASRLVVDTGIHAFGWSRAKAIDYLYANTLLARNNVENEVDRYIAWPGQALAYKLGQREILALRALARERLGERFSYPEFHDRILENGAVSLSVLRARVQRWLGVPSEGAALEASAR